MPKIIPKIYWNKKWLENEYITLNKSMQEIADEQGCHRVTIDRWIKIYNIKKEHPKRGPKKGTNFKNTVYLIPKRIREDQIRKDVALVMDLSIGMTIMTKALTEEFGMTEDEVKNEVGIKKMSMLQKAKLASKMAQFKMMRKKS